MIEKFSKTFCTIVIELIVVIVTAPTTHRRCQVLWKNASNQHNVMGRRKRERENNKEWDIIKIFVSINGERGDKKRAYDELLRYGNELTYMRVA